MFLTDADGKVLTGRFGHRYLEADPLDAPVVTTDDFALVDEVIDGATVTVLYAKVPTPVVGATRYRVTASGLGGQHITGSGELERVVIVPKTTDGYNLPVTIRAENDTQKGYQAYPGDIAVPPSEATSTVTLVSDPTVTLNGGALIGSMVVLGAPIFDGPVLSLLTRHYISDDGFATETEVLDFAAPAPAPASWLGYSYATEYRASGPSNVVTVRTTPTAVFDDVEEPDVTPTALNADEWDVTVKDGPSDTYVIGYKFLRSGVTPENVQWARVIIENFPDPASYESYWKDCVYDAVNDVYWGYLDGSEKTFADGQLTTHLRLRYRTSSTGSYSPTSTTSKQIDDSSIVEPPPASDIGWHHIRMRLKQEYEAGLLGGAGGQFFTFLQRAPSNPSLLVGCGDTQGSWYSEDDGHNWKKAPDEGLRAHFNSGIMVDPEDEDVWYICGTAGFKVEARGYCGLYKSYDKGAHWELKQVINYTGLGSKSRSHTIDYNRNNPDHIVAVVPICSDTLAGYNTSGYIRAELWDSNDRGETWNKVRDLSLATYGIVKAVYYDPETTDKLWLCTENGVYISTNGGTTFGSRVVIKSGHATAYECFSLDFNPQDATEIYAAITAKSTTVSGAVGLYRTTNAFSTPGTQITLPASFPISQIAVGYAASDEGDPYAWSPVASRRLAIVGRSGGENKLQVSLNGGSTWQATTVARSPGEGDGSISDANHTGTFPFRLTQFLPHPRNPNSAFVHSRAFQYRTDNFLHYYYSGEGHEGTQAGNNGEYSVAFSFGSHPNAYREFNVGVTDVGFWRTVTGGDYFWHTLIKAKDPDDNTKLACSANAVAIHPNNSSYSIASSGHIKLTDTYYFHTTKEFPALEASGDWKNISASKGSQIPSFLKWHKSDPSVVYSKSYKWINCDTANPTVQNYGATLSGNAAAVYPGNNDILFGVRSNNTIITKSLDKGATWSVFADLGWSAHGVDNRYPIVVPHPSNSSIIYTKSSGGDLARITNTGGTSFSVKTYGLLSQYRTENPDSLPVAAYVASFAIDPNDLNLAFASVQSVGYCAIYRSTNFQSSNPTWENVTYNLWRGVALVLHFNPFNGDCFGVASAVGGLWVFPPPEGAVRPKPSFASRFIVP
jgi:hypothetical protein